MVRFVRRYALLMGGLFFGTLFFFHDSGRADLTPLNPLTVAGCAAAHQVGPIAPTMPLPSERRQPLMLQQAAMKAYIDPGTEIRLFVDIGQQEPEQVGPVIFGGLDSGARMLVVSTDEPGWRDLPADAVRRIAIIKRSKARRYATKGLLYGGLTGIIASVAVGTANDEAEIGLLCAPFFGAAGGAYGAAVGAAAGGIAGVDRAYRIDPTAWRIALPAKTEAATTEPATPVTVPSEAALEPVLAVPVTVPVEPVEAPQEPAVEASEESAPADAPVP